MKLFTLAVAAATALCTTASAADLPPPKPTARDLYVACYLLARESDVPKRADGTEKLFSSSYCELASISMIASREGEKNPSKYKFCLDGGAATSVNISRAMAFAYLDYYESSALKDKSTDGSVAYLLALMARWPCPA